MNAFATVIYLIVRLKIVLLRVSIAADSLASGIAGHGGAMRAMKGMEGP